MAYPATTLPAPAWPAQPAVGNPDVANGAGAMVVSLSVVAVIGALLGGATGAGAAYALVGGVRNAYRSGSLWHSENAEERREAGQTGVLSVLGLGIAGALAYHSWAEHKVRKEE